MDIEKLRNELIEVKDLFQNYYENLVVLNANIEERKRHLKSYLYRLGELIKQWDECSKICDGYTEKGIKLLTYMNDVFGSMNLELDFILFYKYGYTEEKFTHLKKELKALSYHFYEEKEEEFQKQMKQKGWDYGLYLKLGDEAIDLMTSERKDYTKLVEYGYYHAIITPKTNHYEQELKQYQDYLIPHGYIYTTMNYAPGDIATELSKAFDGTVEFDDTIPVYSNGFKYPDLENNKYLEKQNEFIKLKHNKEFMKDMKEFQEISLKRQMLQCYLNREIEMRSKVIKKNSNNVESKILFLERYWYDSLDGDEYQIDIFRSLEHEWIRKSDEDSFAGLWMVEPEYNMCNDKFYHETRRVITRQLFKLIEREKIPLIRPYNEDAILNNKFVIEPNKQLDFECLMHEYYTNFGMSSYEFVKMIQEKYHCKVHFNKKVVDLLEYDRHAYFYHSELEKEKLNTMCVPALQRKNSKQ